jgi:lysophospholipase L1-like esterase
VENWASDSFSNYSIVDLIWLIGPADRPMGGLTVASGAPRRAVNDGIHFSSDGYGDLANVVSGVHESWLAE